MTIKALPALRFALTGAVALFAHTTFAQMWQTVDNALSAGGFDAVPQAMGRDPFGNVYAAGYAVLNANYDFVAAIKKSSDGGATWSVIDNFSQGESAPSYEYLGIASDAAGILYAAGAGNIGWFVRQSLDGGLTWQTVDNVSGAARAVASDAAGNVYVAGNVNSAWIVRKGTPGGTAWSTIDTFSPGGLGRASGVFCHPSAGIFVVGWGRGGGKKGSDQQWYVRRSLNSGATWTTVDAYLGGSPDGIGADASGNIFVVGANAGHWIVRKSANGGSSWATVDDFRACVTVSTRPPRTQCYDASANGFAMDAQGNLFVAGSTASASGRQWIIRSSAGGVGSWQTADQFQHTSGHSAVAMAIVADTAGNVFAGGWGEDATIAAHWLVRKLPAP